MRYYVDLDIPYVLLAATPKRVAISSQLLLFYSWNTVLIKMSSMLEYIDV
jgi:hypothetical protein